jgi:hypothetical protein
MPVGHIDKSIGRPAKTDRFDPIAVPIPDERNIARVPENISGVRRSNSASVATQSVDDVNTRICGSIDRKAVATVSVEVACQRKISRVAEQEGPFGRTRGVAVTEECLPGRTAVETG